MVIDVSNFQGNIDWAAVKAAGVEGAIIRCGWGQDTASQNDPKFKRNADECIRLGIPFGVYLYSYAKTTSQAKGEAEHTMRLCSPYKDKMTYPVFYDLEQAGTESGAVERARVWCDILQKNGFKVGIYANLNWWRNYLKGLNEFPKWVACYGSTKPNVSGMVAWQYTSKGRVNGISGNVDCSQNYGLATGTTPAPAPAEPKKSNEEIAAEVWAGKWGNGVDRVSRLTAAGYDAKAIQKLVDVGVGKPTAQTDNGAANTGADDGAVYYTIQKNDTLSVIAKKFGVTQKQLIAWNNIKNKNLIITGQKMRVK